MEEKKLNENYENDPPFIFNAEKLQDVTKEIEKEKKNIDRILKANPEIELELLKYERKQICFNGLSACLIEHPEDEEIMPPYKIEKNKRMQERVRYIINGYIDAEWYMLKTIQEEPFIYTDLIKMYHYRMFADNPNMDFNDKNKYRYVDMVDTGWDFKAVESFKIPAAMDDAIIQYAHCEPNYTTAERFGQIAKLHAQIVRIQPFVDGNKRTAFLVSNAMLKMYGYPIVDVCKDKEESEEYRKRLDKAIAGRDVTDLADWFAEKVKNQQSEIIKMAASDIIEQNYDRQKQDDLQK